jgi:hypothetical protein
MVFKIKKVKTALSYNLCSELLMSLMNCTGYCSGSLNLELSKSLPSVHPHFSTLNDGIERRFRLDLINSHIDGEIIQLD